MQVTEIHTEGLKRQYKITVPAADVETQVTAKLGELAKTVRVPGFRPGKAPVNLIRQRYLASVMNDVLEATVQTSSAKAVKERGLRPAFQPKVKIEQFELDTGVEFTIDFEILPEIALADFSALEIERPVAEVTEAAVDKGLEKLRTETRASRKVEEDRAAKAGDTLVIDFLGKEEGKPFEGGSGKDFHLFLGSGMFIPGFEDQLIGARGGDEKRLNLIFPDDYPVATLKGKPVTFDVTVKELREPEEVQLNDDFAKALGHDSLEALRAAVRGQVEHEYAAAGYLRTKRALFDRLDAAYRFEVPPSLEESEFEGIWAQFEKAKAANERDPLLEGKSDEEIREDYKRMANRRVRLGLLLTEIGRVHKIDVEPQEIRSALLNLARQYPGQERKVLEFFTKNPEAIAQIRGPIFEDKVVSHLLSAAKVTDKQVTPEDLLKLDAE